MTYLYLDDEDEAALGPFVRDIPSFVDGLKIRHEPPVGYRGQLAALEDASFNGLILDMRLDEYPNWKVDGEQADYRAATLAQELRTRATETIAKGETTDLEVPIVLWSSEEKLRASYMRDDTSHDLFDLKCVKGDLGEEAYAREVAAQLVALADGYREIITWRNESQHPRLPSLLGLEDHDFLDERLVQWFAGRPKLPAHEYARFLLQGVINIPGPLIDRRTLAARLGVDLERSPGFDSLVASHFAGAAYGGTFGRGWPRWWAALVEAAWRTLDAEAGPLRKLTAEQRAEVLRRHGAEDIEPATPLREEYSSAFWTLCQGTSRPLDPRDGFVLDGVGRYPWETSQYVSIQAYLTREADQKNLRVSPLERGRFERARHALARP